MNFIHASFLAAGLAVALPIVIHLLFRQRTRDVSIGSIRFLHQVVKEHRRSKRVRQWLLLALRMLAVLLLAALFARPYWDQTEKLALEREVVLLIDRSASMAAIGNSGKPAFATAVEQAQDELKKLPEQVIVHVAVCDAGGVKEIAIVELAKLSTSEAATDHALAIEWARDVLQQSKRSQREIILFTDLQRSGLASAAQKLPANIKFSVRDAGQTLPSNVSIVAAEANQTEIRPDAPVTVRATVRNFSALPARGVELLAEIEGTSGKLTAKKELEIAAHGTATIDLPIAVKNDGVYRGKLELLTSNTGRRDSLLIDNRRWLAFEARQPERVLLVDGEEGRAVFQNETYYLETALRIRSEEAGGRLRSFEPERIVWENGSGFPRLDGYRAVVLANVRRLTDDDAARLKSYVQAGGNLLIFAGDQVSQATLLPLQQAELLPGEVATTVTENSIRITDWAKTHPALTCFNDPQFGDLRRIQLQKSLPISKLASESVALLTANEQTIAAERTIGKGRVLYVGFTADRDWTELPQSRLYVPFVRQLLAHLTNQLADGSLVVERIVKKSEERTGLTEQDGKWQVVNLDPRESAPERLAADDLQKLFGGIRSADKTFAESEALALLLPPDSLRPDEIWTVIAWLLLFLLAAETLLAGRVHA
jgi:hypothetical protein